jgi:hypothetical protein
MTKSKKTKAPKFTATASDVGKAVLANVSNLKATWAILRRADTKQDEVKFAAHAARNYAMFEDVAKFPIYDAKMEAKHLALVMGSTAKTPAKGRQSITEEQAKRNAGHRKFWERLLKDAGIVSTDSKSGNKNAAKTADATVTGDTAKAPASVAPVIKKYAEPKAVQAHIQRELQALLAMVNANREPIAGKPGPASPFVSWMADTVEKFASIKLEG